MTRDTLLVIDDSPLDLAILNEIFKHLFQVVCFEESRPAMAYIRRNSPRVCAVLLDVCLGRRGAGFQVLQQLQAAPETASIPVILITADAREEYVLNGLEKGAVDFLAKPVTPQMIQERVCAAVRTAWPAGTTVLDVEKPDSPPHSPESERCLPDLAGRWERLLQLFFQSRPQLHSSRYQLLGRITATLARSYAAVFPESGLDAEEADIIGQAAMFCDIGLLGVPDNIISQGPDQTGAGREIYYQHTILGHALFSTGMTDGRHLADYAAEIAYWHHKRHDGGGFPADDPSGPIPLCAQFTHTALRLLAYLEYFQDHADPLQRALRALAGEAGHTISPEMFQCAQAAREVIQQQFLQP